MNVSHLPRSHAKTSWGLLRDVRKFVLREAAAIDMEVCAGMASERWAGARPACGVVGCLLGWSGILARPAHVKTWTRVSTDTTLLLDNNDVINYHTVGRGDYKEFVFNTGEGDACGTTRPGTKAHARAVVRRLDKFMRINKQALKAHRLPGC